MKYKIISIFATKVPMTEGSSLNTRTYKLQYTQTYWSWRSFRRVTETKNAYKEKYAAWFKDSETGGFLHTKLDSIINAYMANNDIPCSN